MRPAPVLPIATDIRIRPAAVREVAGPTGGALPIGPVLRGPVADDLNDTLVTGGS